MSVDYISFSVPAVPPSVNHYVKHTRAGRHYRVREADDFFRLVGLATKGKKLVSPAYGVQIHIFLGAGQKGDVDNFPKVVLDAMVSYGVITSDSKITRMYVHKQRDRLQPRTEVDVWAIDSSEKKTERRRRVAPGRAVQGT